MKIIVSLFCLVLLSGCAAPSWVPFLGDDAPVEKELSPEEAREVQFHDWLKHKRNHRNYATRAEAEEAFDAQMERKRQEQEWKDYKIEKGITGGGHEY